MYMYIYMYVCINPRQCRRALTMYMSVCLCTKEAAGSQRRIFFFVPDA